MTAKEIYDSVPVGSLIRYSDRQPRPPAKRVQWRRAWANRNKQGRLVAKIPPGANGAKPCFVLRVDETPLLVSDELIGLDHPLVFDVIWQPSAPTT